MEQKKVHDDKEKCKEHAYTVATILRMEGKQKLY